MRHLRLSLFIGLFALSACGEKFISTVDLGFESKPVIGCFITPGDSIIVVTISMSDPISSNYQFSFNIRSDANVRLISENQTLTLTYDAARKYYTVVAPNFVQPGFKYRIEVDLDNQRHLAETTVPQVYNNQLQFELLMSTVPGQSRIDTIYGFRKSWLSPENGPYYFGSVAHLETYLDGELIYISPSNPGRSSEVRLQYFTGTEAMRKYQWEYADAFRFRMPRASDEHQYRFSTELLFTDIAFYRYHTSIDQHRKSSGEFFVEPSPVYSSFDNALGVFGSFVKSKAFTPFF